MSVDDFGVTVQDVKRRLNGIIDTSFIGANTEPVSDTDITIAVEDRAAEMAGTLEAQAVGAPDLSGEALRQVQNAVADGAAAEVLRTLGHTGADYQALADRYEKHRDEYQSDTTLDRDNDRVGSTVSLTDRPSPYTGDPWQM